MTLRRHDDDDDDDDNNNNNNDLQCCFDFYRTALCSNTPRRIHSVD